MRFSNATRSESSDNVLHFAGPMAAIRPSRKKNEKFETSNRGTAENKHRVNRHQSKRHRSPHARHGRERVPGKQATGPRPRHGFRRTDPCWWSVRILMTVVAGGPGD